MRLLELEVENFKNLRALKINFNESSPYTVLVGENGSGKSNLIEAIALIFRSLDLEAEAPFGYHIRYLCHGNEVDIKATEDSTPRFAVRANGAPDFEDISKSKFMDADEDDRPRYRPAFVFGYYSGPSDRLATLFEKHRDRYYKHIIKPKSVRGQKKISSNSLRRLFYARTLHGQFALLAFFMRPPTGDKDDRAFLREHLQIEALDSVLFALNQPPWKRQSGGDSRFWNAEGEVREFLDRLYGASLMPTRLPRHIPIDLAKSPSVECLYLFLPNSAALEHVYGHYGNEYAFFTALESTYISRVLSEVRTRVRMTPAAGGGEVTYRDLSEGEQQLLMVLGLLKFTAEEETLFLLDEPDTHLNPAWSTQYLDFLNRFVKRPQSCHIIMSTHDPLVFSRLKKDQVRIMQKDETGKVKAEAPENDPRGMGVAAILTSDLFRLRTTLDPETQAELDRQRLLAMKKSLTEAEEAELRTISTRLATLGLTQTTRDPIYSRFLKAWSDQADPSWTQTVEFTPEQIKEQERLAAQIVNKLQREQEKNQ